MTECYCGSDLTTNCYEPSITCPSKCPEIRPETGQGCNMEQQLTCRYNEGMCPTSECNCLQGVYVCNEFCYDMANTENMDGSMTEEAEDPKEDIPSTDADVTHKHKKKKKKDKKGKSRTEKVEKKGKKDKKGKKLEKYRK